MDEAAIREELAALGASLFQRGYSVGTAGNISVRLPDGYGLDFLSQVTLAAPVVVLTASIDAETRQQLLAQGLRFVIKPLTARELIELVTTTLAKGYAHDPSTDPDRG